MRGEKNLPIIFVFVTALIFVLAGCGDSNDDNNADPATPEVTGDVALVTEEATVEANEAVAEVTAAVTEEVAETPDIFDTGNPSTSADGSYAITVSYLLEEGSFSEIDTAAPEGQRWVALGATISNETTDAIDISPESLTLIDGNGDRYTAQPSSESLTPSLTDTTIAAGESLLGLALFAINENVIPVRVEWCVDAACENVLVANVA